MRGSDRSMRREIDDIALSNHLSKSGSRQFTYPGPQQPLTGYGRKDMDDMVLNQHINQYQHGTAGSQYSSRETGYVSDGNPELPISAQFYYPSDPPAVSLGVIPGEQFVAPYVPQPMGNNVGVPATYRIKGDSTYMERSEVETEIF